MSRKLAMHLFSEMALAGYRASTTRQCRARRDERGPGIDPAPPLHCRSPDQCYDDSWRGVRLSYIGRDASAAKCHKKGGARNLWHKRLELDQQMDVAFSQPTCAGESSQGGSRRPAALLLIGLSMVFLVSVFYKAPDGDYFTICMFKAITGLPCPGCGLTHSFCALGKGNIPGAFGYNALGPPIFLLAVGFWLRSAAVLLGRVRPVQALDRIARRARLAQVLLIALAAYGVVRIVYILAF
jgi:hypothetical protein